MQALRPIFSVWLTATLAALAQGYGARSARQESASSAALGKNNRSVEQAIAALEDEAEANRRVDKSSDYLTDADFVGIGVGGTLYDRTSSAHLFQSGRVKTESLEVSDRRIRLFGKTAVVTFVRHLRDSFDGKSRVEQHRCTRVWAVRKGKWRIVSFQATRVLEPAAK